jgi:hypothetical protein
MSETVTTTIQHVDLEPNTAQPGQNIYNFSVAIRGVTNDPEVANMTEWQPFCLLIMNKIAPPSFPAPSPPIPYPITFAESPVSLDAAPNGEFSLTLHFSLSRSELFDKFFEPNAVMVTLQLTSLSLRPENRDLKVTREVEVYVKNSNPVESDRTVALK